MGKSYSTCFDPRNVSFNVYKSRETKYDVEKRDLTKCYMRSKLGNNDDATCENGAVVNGVETEDHSFLAVLNGDMPICKQPKN